MNWMELESECETIKSFVKDDGNSIIFLDKTRDVIFGINTFGYVELNNFNNTTVSDDNLIIEFLSSSNQENWFKNIDLNKRLENL